MVATNHGERVGHDLVAPLLKRLLLTIAVGAVLIAITAAVFGVTRIVISSLLNAVVAGLMLLLVRRGRVLAASLIEAITLTASSVYALISGYGLLDVSLLILPSLFLLTSVLLSARWMLLVVLATNTAVLSIGLAEKLGWLIRPNSALVEYDDIVIAIILLSMTAVFVLYLVSTLRHSIIQSRSAHARTRDILDATSDAIVIHEPRNGAIVEVNETALRMFGCDRSAIVTQSPVDSGLAAGYLRQAVDHVRRATSEGPQRFEWLAKREGNSFWLEVILRGASIADDQCVVAVLRDITERRRLEQRVREAETFRAVGQLAGGVAHDFNNQLVGILGNAEFMLEAATGNHELQACAEAVLSSGHRAAALTRQLLAFARRARLHNVPVDTHQLIAEVAGLACRSIDKRIVIEQQLEAEHAVTIGDASALQNALLNLLLNARDAMPSGGTVRFTTRNLDLRRQSFRDSNPSLAPGAYIEVCVADTGCGIGPEVIGNVFEPFFTTKGSGTGMGLAAVRGTVLEHQGSVDVTSEVGRGSTFRLLLPVSDEAVEPCPSLASDPKSAHGRSQILVVDDESSVTSVVKSALVRGGYEVEACNDGQRAIELCGSRHFDLVLLDVMMPDLDGLEVLQRVRARRSDTRVIVMTGHAPESVQTRLLEYPEIAVLPKPFLPKDLLHEVRAALAHPPPA